MHKRNFSLTSGKCLNDDNYNILAFDVRVDGDDISVLLPDVGDLDLVIATNKWMIKRDTARTLDRGNYDVDPSDSVVDIVSAKESTVCGPTCGDNKLDW